MPIVSYADTDAPHIRDAAQAIAATRYDGKLLNIDRVLLQNPELALGWRGFFGAVRTKCGLSDRLREIASLRVAVLNRAEYEFAQHAPIALTLGLSQAQLESLRTSAPTGFEPEEQLVIELTDAMTRNVQLPKALATRLTQQFNDRSLIELTVTIGAYNCVSRVLEALQIENE